MLRKNLWSVLLLAFLVACAAPALEGEDPETTGEAALETAEADVPEAEGEEEGEEVEIPPEGALPLSEIASQLEAKEYTPIIEAELEDGVWEIEYVVDDEAQELLVDPMTGEILPEESEEEQSEESDS